MIAGATRQKRALVVEDDPVWLQIVCEQLVIAGLHPVEAPTRDRAVAEIDAGDFAVLIVDPSLGRGVGEISENVDGVKLIEQLHQRKMDAPVIVVSATDNVELVAYLFMDCGVKGFFGKASFSRFDTMGRFRQMVTRLVEPVDTEALAGTEAADDGATGEQQWAGSARRLEVGSGWREWAEVVMVWALAVFIVAGMAYTVGYDLVQKQPLDWMYLVSLLLLGVITGYVRHFGWPGGPQVSR